MRQMILFFLIGIGFLVNSCSVNPQDLGIDSNRERENAEKLNEPPHRTSCTTDFKNFVYPSAFTPGEEFPLKDGKLDAGQPGDYKSNIGYIFLAEYYADLVGDERNEGIITLAAITGGSAAPIVVYVFNMENSQPRLLWKYVSGDRADGGLRNIYESNRQLIIETYEPSPGGGACCPKSYTKTIYDWKSDAFVEIETESGIPNPSSGAFFVGKSTPCG